MLEQYKDAVTELTWRFLRSDAEIGVRGQSFEGRGGTSFDAASSSRLHDAQIRLAETNAHDRRRRIDITLALTGDARPLIERIFEPYGRVSASVDAYFTVAGLRLFGIASRTTAAQHAFERKKQNRYEDRRAKLYKKLPAAPVTDADKLAREHADRQHTLLVRTLDAWRIEDWFNDEWLSKSRVTADVARLRTHKPAGHVFERILNESVTVVAGALAVYEEHRQARVAREEIAKKKLLDEKLRETHERLWGTP